MIAEVIGWKFNHQSGMATKGGVITEFPNGIPSQADQDLWTAEYNARDLQAEKDAAIDERIDNDPLFKAFEEELALANGITPAAQRANIKGRVA